MPSNPPPTRLARPLLAWFQRAKRDLPWRGTRDPYRVLVSEVMLQQTQVERVIPFYERFLKRFPTLELLASAPLDDVLRAWSGLGYYARARHLHAAARAVVEQHSGRLPDTFESLRALPGVGVYTAGAVASIAFGQPVPAVDANARRVLSRIFYRPDASPEDALRRVRLVAAAVPMRAPGDYNQALMELGSVVCTPRAPACQACCLAQMCAFCARQHLLRAREEPLASAGTRGRRAPRAHSACAVVRRRGRVLIAQRPPTGLWGGLWEFPNCEYTAPKAPRIALRALLREAFSLEVEPGSEIATLTHGVTDRRVTLTAYDCGAVRGRTRARRHPRTRWVAPEDLIGYALPSPHRRVAELL